ncbi:hypothetical protein VNO78_25609 [Psophocarpus tetragonolobus]|uniref:Uncharacterized protein n=1 Tax=Psophocarpus tetragonolobus TaxID=3891 RepID=A0AAN9S7F6_PSOTE
MWCVIWVIINFDPEWKFNAAPALVFQHVRVGNVHSFHLLMTFPCLLHTSNLHNLSIKSSQALTSGDMALFGLVISIR